MKAMHLGLVLGSLLSLHAASDWFQIRIVDEQTGRGVPLVKLTTTNHIACYTDSNGIVAWNEPGLMDRNVYFTIESPGYRFSGGGKSLRPTRGGHVELKIQRLNIAERLYRVTGQGIYRDSVLTGYPVPIHEPVLNAQVMGQDTVRAVPYRGKLFWLWGDTDRAGGPLGNFSTTSATSELPGQGGLDPSIGVDFKYFTEPGGFVKQMCRVTPTGMKWLHALTTLRDPSGVERLVARYDVVTGGDMKAAESGLVVFDDAKEEFVRLVKFPSPDPAVGPGGVPPLRVRSGGVEYFYFCDLHNWPTVRVRADWNSIQNLSVYEVFDGTWQRSATLPTGKRAFVDIETGESVGAHANVQWNDFRKRWIAIAEKMVGEVWYSEADTPVGPWVYATRVATHGKYTYYWAASHPFFDQDGGRLIYFEGTYTDTFSGNPVITPRYNYNQLMYRLALDDPRLFLPAPVYRLHDGRYMMREGVDAAGAWNQIAAIPFFALPQGRQRPGTVKIADLFYALPATQTAAPDLDGTWDCGMGISIGLSVHGTAADVKVSDTPPARGTLRDGIVSFRVSDDGKVIDATARIDGSKLAVTWEGESAECTRAIPKEHWSDSKSLVPLFYYDGTYSTEPRPGAKPIARVWRNPMDKLALDRDAVPVH